MILPLWVRFLSLFTFEKLALNQLFFHIYRAHVLQYDKSKEGNRDQRYMGR